MLFEDISQLVRHDATGQVIGMKILGRGTLNFCKQGVSRINVLAGWRGRRGVVDVFGDDFGAGENINSCGAAGPFHQTVTRSFL